MKQGPVPAKRTKKNINKEVHCEKRAFLRVGQREKIP